MITQKLNMWAKFSLCDTYYAEWYGVGVVATLTARDSSYLPCMYYVSKNVQTTN